MNRESKVSREVQNHNDEMLNQVTAYCNNHLDCRRTLVLQYFQQDFTREECAETCDNCQSKNYVKFTPKDVTDHAKNILDMIKAAQSNPDIGDITSKQFADAYRGSMSKQVRLFGDFDRFSLNCLVDQRQRTQHPQRCRQGRRAFPRRCRTPLQFAFERRYHARQDRRKRPIFVLLPGCKSSIRLVMWSLLRFSCSPVEMPTKFIAESAKTRPRAGKLGSRCRAKRRRRPS